ncbi:MAG: inosose dehydratase [Candidatus Paceibacteria bacterium]|jgi:inosose dehydratase
MANVRIACQTYTWQMSGGYVGKLDHILSLLGKTGFRGVEPETQYLGRLSDPAALRSSLEDNNLQLAALCLVEDWLAPEESGGERARADECLDLLAHFPGTLLNLCQMPTTRPNDSQQLLQRQKDLLACVQSIASRAAARDIVCAYHPNSPDTSIFRTAQDYTVLLPNLGESLGWVPDCGHLAKVGMDPLEWITSHRSLVRHIHYKDMDAHGAWAEMGEGVIDYEAITRFLVTSDYQGWIVVEDESERAIPEPDQVTRDDWNWIERHLIPIVS